MTNDIQKALELAKEIEEYDPAVHVWPDITLEKVKVLARALIACREPVEIDLAGDQPKRCPSCHDDLICKGDKFCHNCGRPIGNPDMGYAHHVAAQMAFDPACEAKGPDGKTLSPEAAYAELAREVASLQERLDATASALLGASRKVAELRADLDWTLERRAIVIDGTVYDKCSWRSGAELHQIPDKGGLLADFRRAAIRSAREKSR